MKSSPKTGVVTKKKQTASKTSLSNKVSRSAFSSAISRYLAFDDKETILMTKTSGSIAVNKSK
jgi:hypothetical protein